jgi:hypothetical protein
LEPLVEKRFPGISVAGDLSLVHREAYSGTALDRTTLEVAGWAIVRDSPVDHVEVSKEEVS